jgi:hypothetical protein
MKPRADIATIVISITDAADAPAREPTPWHDDFGPMPDWDLLRQPKPDVEFDQRVAW